MWHTFGEILTEAQTGFSVSSLSQPLEAMRGEAGAGRSEGRVAHLWGILISPDSRSHPRW